MNIEGHGKSGLRGDTSYVKGPGKSRDDCIYCGFNKTKRTNIMLYADDTKI